MKCPKCSFTPVSERARFCPNCGTRLVSGGETVEISAERGGAVRVGEQLDELGPDNKPAPRKKQDND